ncbi:type II secretion system protein N [Glaciimonas sp. Cout2]|uniref:type II secretion system protein N n=1 Tax=Glaciimonas sp. Cout2 TaxID=3048621 RepID=UPI002B22D628|nr:type II secretion system protein N [Glaciimonas sp. Cout2]MEB0010535.1 type II secretion system protein N [Glaciimonas sp. Cout2]
MRALTLGIRWAGAATLSVLITVLVFLPAAWLGPLLENKTGGRITLGDTQGSLWRGSAFIGVAANDNGPVMPLLPGRLVWHLSPLVLVGLVDATFANVQVLSQPVTVRGNWTSLTISAASVAVPAERLMAFGAPLNTLQPSGMIRLAWNPMTLLRTTKGLDLHGVMTLDMIGIGSRLSPVKPLGSYRMHFDWMGNQAGLTLKTITGSLLLNGSGNLHNSHVQFSGTAEAAAGQEKQLAMILSLIGQPRHLNGKNVTDLDFKS